MKPTPTFLMTNRCNAAIGEPVAYRPFSVSVEGVEHHLALHQMYGEWQVSHPASGGRVLVIKGSHKGILVSSKGMGVRAARDAALLQVQALAARVGPGEFNARLASKAIATQLTQD